MSCNVALEYIDFRKKCCLKYLKYILKNRFDKDISLEFLGVYEKVRYYNLFLNKQKSFSANVNYYMKDIENKLVEKYDNKVDLVKDTGCLFRYLMVFEGVKKVDNYDFIWKDLCDRFNLDREYIEKLRYIISQDVKSEEDFLDKLDSKDFSISCTRCNISNLYNVSIGYDLRIPKLYSQYAIDKVFNSEIISEDMVFIIYYMVSKIIIENMIVGDFKKVYLVDFCVSLFQKKDKVKRLFNIIDNDLVREQLSIKILYKDFMTYQDIFYDYMRRGYNFSIILSSLDVLDEFDFQKLGVFRYVINCGNNDDKLKRLDNVIVGR